MVSSLHRDCGCSGIHKIHNWEFGNEAIRLAYNYLIGDIGKVALQQDNDSFWLITDNSPLSFVQIGGSGGGGDGYFTEETHEDVRQLIHLVHNGPFEGFLSGSYREILPAESPFPSSIIWYEASDKLKKIVEKIIVRNASQFPVTISYNVYYDNGITIAASIVDSITYSGSFEVSRERSIL